MTLQVRISELTVTLDQSIESGSAWVGAEVQWIAHAGLVLLLPRARISLAKVFFTNRSQENSFQTRLANLRRQLPTTSMSSSSVGELGAVQLPICPL